MLLVLKICQAKGELRVLTSAGTGYSPVVGLSSVMRFHVWWVRGYLSAGRVDISGGEIGDLVRGVEHT